MIHGKRGRFAKDDLPIVEACVIFPGVTAASAALILEKGSRLTRTQMTALRVLASGRPHDGVRVTPQEVEDNEWEVGHPKKPKMGRPRLGGERRVKLETTVDASTLAAIDNDTRALESRGQVLDRWAKERTSAGA